MSRFDALDLILEQARRFKKNDDFVQKGLGRDNPILEGEKVEDDIFFIKETIKFLGIKIKIYKREGEQIETTKGNYNEDGWIVDFISNDKAIFYLNYPKDTKKKLLYSFLSSIKEFEIKEKKHLLIK